MAERFVRQEIVINYLLADPLKHLVHLKYLHLYGDILTCHYVEHANGAGVLLSYPTQEVFWDVQAYPTSQSILLLTASDPIAAEMLLNTVEENYPADARLVFKFTDTFFKDVFARAFELDFQRAMSSFTAPPNAHFAPDAEVVIAQTPDPRCVDLYVKNGYSREEIDSYFADGALSFALYENGEPVCVCMAYANYENIWEIGGLNTVEHARRKGHARRVVQTALYTLAEHGKIPRYAVLDTNTASIQLAESLGLQPFLRLEHYLAIRFD